MYFTLQSYSWINKSLATNQGLIENSKSVKFSFYIPILLTLSFVSQLIYGGTTYAVIVGISNYEQFTPTSGDLRYSDRDAIYFRDYLTSPRGGNIPASQVILLTNNRASKDMIIKALSIFKKAAKEDRVIFYFSGHGNRGIFLPYDTDGAHPVLTYPELKKAFRESNATNKICITDACKGGFMKMKSYSDQTSATTPDDQLHTNSNVLVFLSCLPQQVSVEYRDLGQGVFTYFLLKALKGEADTDHDNTVTAYELYKYVSENVKDFSLQHHPETDPQTPMMYGKFDKDMPIAYVN
jgi:uncharacterized caspase-like protein